MPHVEAGASVDLLLERTVESGMALVAAAGLVALASVLHRGSWRLLRNVVTIVHEGGHAIVALLTGRRLAGIRLHSDTSGVTVSVGRPRGPGMIATLVAGYPAPSLLGLLAAYLVTNGMTRGLLIGSVVVLAAMLLAIRNPFGVLSVLLTGAVIFLVAWFAAVEVQEAFGLLFAWFLLFAGVRPVRELGRMRNRPDTRDSDAHQLARLTAAGPLMWIVVFLLINLSALVVGGGLLLGLL
ncbi:MULTISPECIES: M50 family metallopeptidase [Actinoalloteichus]|uniref:Peptidase M50B-like n=1 Tax=Actinoalloteichus caeruleus DSM 43889 TaxID=1120930 RepID=A0ABT1JBL8_ACTCY|nr:Peptidase M50B-like [Actinoalloteichus caeruleus DSM 43889]